MKHLVTLAGSLSIVILSFSVYAQQPVLMSNTTFTVLTGMVTISDSVMVFIDAKNADRLYMTTGEPNSEIELLKASDIVFCHEKIPDGFNGSFLGANQRAINGKVFFTARDTGAGNNIQWWCTDGTVGGTILLGDFNTSSGIFSDGQLAVAGNIIYLTSPTGVLWRTDGTYEGTYAITGPEVQVWGSLRSPIALGDSILFWGDDATYGNEVWITDGSVGGEKLLKDIGPGANGSVPRYFTLFDERIFFQATPSGFDAQLWSTNGSEAGTKSVKPSGCESPADLTVFNGYLYFSAAGSGNNRELWRSNGTEPGTVLFKDLKVNGGSDPTAFLATDSLMYFIAYETANNGLFRTNGTVSGTFKIFQGGAEFIGTCAEVTNDLYFISTGSTKEFYKTDGSECRTSQFTVNLDGDALYQLLAVNGSDLYVSATNSDGQRLWKLETVPISAVEICNGIDDDCNGIIDDDPIVSISPSGAIDVCKGIAQTFTTQAASNTSYQWSKNGNAISGATQNTFTTGKSEHGDYSVTVNRTNGCIATSDPTILNRLDQPDAIITPLGNLDICQAGSVDLQANSGAGLSYQWLKKGNDIAGAINQIYTATKKGNYQVMVTNSEGCTKKSAKVKVTNTCREGDETISSSTLEAFPNPFNNFTRIDLSELNPDEDQLHVLITDLSGKILFQNVFSSLSQIEIGNELRAGFYLVEVNGKNYHQVIPIVKE